MRDKPGRDFGAAAQACRHAASIGVQPAQTRQPPGADRFKLRRRALAAEVARKMVACRASADATLFQLVEMPRRARRRPAASARQPATAQGQKSARRLPFRFLARQMHCRGRRARCRRCRPRRRSTRCRKMRVVAVIITMTRRAAEMPRLFRFCVGARRQAARCARRRIAATHTTMAEMMMRPTGRCREGKRYARDGRQASLASD